MKSILSTLLITLGATTAQAQFTFVDSVDFSDGWTNIGGGFYSNGIGGLTPQAGSNFWSVAGGNANRGLWLLTPEVISDEVTITATFDIGDRDDYTFSGGISAYLFADTNNDGAYQYSERVSSVYLTPTPSDGAWESQSLNFGTISSSSLTADSENIAGHAIGVAVISNVADGASFAFDNFQMIAIPEYGTSALIGGMLALGVVIIRRRR